LTEFFSQVFSSSMSNVHWKGYKLMGEGREIFGLRNALCSMPVCRQAGAMRSS